MFNTPLRPFTPFSDKEVGALGLFRSDNKTVDRTMLVLGVFVFIFSYQPSIISDIISSFMSMI